MTTQATETETATPTANMRDAIRTAILDSKGTVEVIEVFGVKVEIRTPSLEDLLQYRNATEDSNIMARAIVNNCWVPGTDDHVFDEADIPQIMKLKFSPDMKKLNATINKILGGDEEIQKKVEDNTKSDQE